MFSIPDFVIIGVYLVATVCLGMTTRGRQDNASDYFTARGGMGGVFGSILVGLSVAATLFSGITFLAFPAVIYQGAFVAYVMTIAIAMPVTFVALAWFLPRYLRAGGEKPYEIIERRFGSGARTFSSIMYTLMRIGWMAALIYAPTLAIMGAWRLDPQWFWPCILIIGLSSTLYTVFGGIRGVIVTDAVQFVVIIAGIGGTIGYALYSLPLPLGDTITLLADAGRLSAFPISFSPAEQFTIFTVAAGVTVSNLGNYIGDQMSLQRYLACGTTKASLRAFNVSIAGVMLVLTLLTGVGLALFAFYHTGGDIHLPEKADQIFPYFIATRLPRVLAALLLAAILAATMSSMTSGINALSASLTLDLLPRTGIHLSPRQELSFARWTSLIVGLAATAAAGFVGRLGSLYDTTQIILGVFAGPLLVVVLFAVTRISLNTYAVIVALLAGSVCGSFAALQPEIAPLWTAPISALATGVTALAMALFVRQHVPLVEASTDHLLPQADT